MLIAAATRFRRATAVSVAAQQFARGMPATAASSAAAAAAAAASRSSSSSSSYTVNGLELSTSGPSSGPRVLVTKPLPGTRWLELLHRAGCRVDVVTNGQTILSVDEITSLIGKDCAGVLGQLTEDWGDTLFKALKDAGGQVYSNYAVGYNNVDVGAATKHGVPVGNTPGVLTETTAELAAALTLSAARRVVEADVFMRGGLYKGWLPDLFIGSLLQGKTVGIVGAGRIGIAYAKMLVEGHKMDVVYYDPFPKPDFEAYVQGYGEFCAKHGERKVSCRRVELEELFKVSDVISLHCLLTPETKHLVDARALGMMKKDTVLVNAARGPVINEADLVKHLQANPDFRVGLDVFEDEPLMAPGLDTCPNAVIVPHIASASMWTRSAMATLAAANVAERIAGNPVHADVGNVVEKFVDADFESVPRKSPSIVNAKELGLELA